MPPTLRRFELVLPVLPRPEVILRHGQADRVAGHFEAWRLRERRDLDLDAGLAVAVALQGQHDRRLFGAAVAHVSAEIGAAAIRGRFRRAWRSTSAP